MTAHRTATTPPRPARLSPSPTAKRRPRILVLSLLGLALVCAACAPPWGAPRPVQYENDAVRMLMDRLQAANTGLDAFKGRGRVTAVAEHGQKMDGRSVWAAARPGRLRFAFLAPTGQPVLSVSCDETWITALNHGEKDYYRRRVDGGSLSGFLPVSIRCADLYNLLAGRPPEVAHDAVHMDVNAAESPGIIALALKRRFRGTVGRLFVDRDTGDLAGVELFDVHGNLVVEARLADVEIVDDYRLPTRIRMTGPKGRIALDVQRIWPETTLDPAVFRIDPP